MYERTINNNNYKTIDKFYLFKAAKNESKLLDLNLTDVMNTWTKQMGHPVINIKLVQDRVQITQKQFLLDPASPPTAESPFK